MKTKGNVVLITGGATGIGAALAGAFLKHGNDVIICGRRRQRLREAKSRMPAIHTRVCDIADPARRKSLFDWTRREFPRLNILVNNAGIQREIDFTGGIADLLRGEDEVETNLRAPIHLSALFIPHLLQQAEAAIVSVSSGLGFVPLAFMPVYCATKAGLHSFTWSLRHQLRETSIKVFEIVPPMVDTELDGGGREDRDQAERGIHPREVAEATLAGLARDQFEIAVGQAQFLRTGARKDPEGTFRMLNPE